MPPWRDRISGTYQARVVAPAISPITGWRGESAARTFGPAVRSGGGDQLVAGDAGLVQDPLDAGNREPADHVVAVVA
jgi:hypothetical protein